MSGTSVPGRWNNLASLAGVGALVCATGHLLAGPGGALVAGAACAGLAGGLAGYRRHRRRRERRAAEAGRARLATREAAIRLAWQITGEFVEAAGWGRSDLDGLRLICRNLAPAQPIGPRIAERLRVAASAVAGGAAERLHQLQGAAAALDAGDPALESLGTALATLETELDSVTFRPGEPVGFDPAAVADAAAQVFSSCAELRQLLRPHVVCDLPHALEQVVTARHAARRERGELILDLRAHNSHVAVRATDASEALAGLMERVFGRGHVAAPVRVSLEDAGAGLRLGLAWSVDDRLRVDPLLVTEPLRALAAYGMRLSVREAPEQNLLQIEVWLPAA
ncbi:MAG: hypothetical protein KBD01_07130 [Acidobacteria bacterium]|nr:hypothetical protein [Acidobacteriota bacterium]